MLFLSGKLSYEGMGYKCHNIRTYERKLGKEIHVGLYVIAKVHTFGRAVVVQYVGSTVDLGVGVLRGTHTSWVRV